MTGTAPSLAVQLYERTEASRLTSNDSHHKRKPKHPRANEGLRRPADTHPYRQRILHRTRVDRLPGQRRAMFAGPVHRRARPDFQQQLEFLRKKRVVIFQSQPEKWVRLNERTAPRHNLSAALRDQVERRELLKNANGIRRTEHRHRAS